MILRQVLKISFRIDATTCSVVLESLAIGVKFRGGYCSKSAGG
jgi:hypothetical protein